MELDIDSVTIDQIANGCSNDPQQFDEVFVASLLSFRRFVVSCCCFISYRRCVGAHAEEETTLIG